MIRTPALQVGLFTAVAWALLTPASARAELTLEQKTLQESCRLLDDPKVRGRMDALELKLLIQCGRQHELGQVRQEVAEAPDAGEAPLAADAQVNNSSGDAGGSSHTQSETSIAINETTGTLCSGYNDSFHGVVQSAGYTGTSRSIDGGATWSDRGALGATSFGDPAMIWRKSDGKFYIAALHSSGLGLWRSDDDCLSFTAVGVAHSSGGDDKEFIAVDNNIASPYYGRIYLVWIDFNAGAQIFSRYTTDGGATWSTPLQISVTNANDYQGAWPAIAPNGDVFVGWVAWLNGFPSGDVQIDIVRSTNGGTSFTAVTPPVTGKDNPRDNTATATCGRPALNGNIRYLPSPQIAVGPNGHLHAVYTYDPDGNGTGDVVNSYYRRSIDNGATWLPEVQIHQVATHDQYFPTLSVSADNTVVVGWYDRRDTSNVNQHFYARVSPDGGTTWAPEIQLTDVSSPVYIDPSLAGCYHGDYDQSAQTSGFAHVVWADDRNVQDGHNDPDVFTEKVPISTDFLVTATQATQAICTPSNAIYNLNVLQFNGFVSPVTLSATGNPAGTTVSFSTNPVTPPGTSNMTIGNTGAALAGSYTIAVTGTAAGPIVHTTNVGLEVFTGSAAVPSPASPANGAIDVVLVPTYSWGAATQAQSYDIEVASDAGFSSIVYAATGLSGTSYTPASALAPLTQYFWHVRANNLCGTSVYSSTFSFTTRAIPPTLLVDDDNDAPDNLAAFAAWLTAAGEAYDVLDTNASANEPTLADLLPYQRVIWWSGDAFGSTAGPGAAGETALAAWLDTNLGKCLFLDSQDYLFDFGITAFGTNYLGIAARTNDVTQTQATGKNFFTTPTYVLSFPANFTNYSDSVTPGAGALVAFNGNLGTPPSTSIYKDNVLWKTVFFTTPLEAFPAANQQAVFQRVLDYCDALFQDGFESGNPSRWDLTFP